jgi:PIN domain nuclease of toxin-antitoxin system
MNLLLDTHVWLWGVREPERLPPAVRRKLDSDDNRRWLSPISVWEVSLLLERGRIDFFRDAASLIQRILDESAVLEVPITHDIALESRRLIKFHDDPADRFLVATARVRDMTLVTADRRILGSGLCHTLPC